MERSRCAGGTLPTGRVSACAAKLYYRTMRYEINETHDPDLKSWVESANDPNTDFPIQNLPFCIFATGSIEDFIATVSNVAGEGGKDLFKNLGFSEKGDETDGELIRTLQEKV